MRQRRVPGIAAAVLFGMGLGSAVCLIQARAFVGAPETSEGEQLVRGSDCLSCHAIDHKVVGPAFHQMAERYTGKAGVESQLVSRIRDGGSGNWGKVPMNPHPKLTDAEIKKMVAWILSLKTDTRAERPAPEETYTYKGSDGETIKTSFPVFLKGKEKERVVTDAVFAGWLQFNSTCFRCHGADATGAAYAPDLRKSLRDGLTLEQFMSISMVGAQAKGMPGWAGFYDEQEMTQIFRYVKARSLGLVQEGRPKSSSD